MMYFFDLDGTLLDSTSVWMDIDVEFLGKHGISPVPPDYTDYVAHHPPLDAAEYTRRRYQLPQSPQEITQAWADMAYHAYAHRLPLKPGAREFLLGCRRQGIPMAILTSCFAHLCQAALEHHGIAHLFQFVLTTGDTGLEKGNGDLYRFAAKKCGLVPENCTVFEDSPGYCAAAKAAGFHIVGFQDKMFAARQAQLRALCGPGRYLSDFCDVTPEMFL